MLMEWSGVEQNGLALGHTINQQLSPRPTDGHDSRDHNELNQPRWDRDNRQRELIVGGIKEK